jgi:NADH-quinone oxidoreductase subunit J
MTPEQILFILIAAFMVVSSILMVHSRHPVYSAVFMISTMFGISGCFVLLDSYFLAVVQVLVYAGAIMVLFLFIIMLLNVDQEGMYQPSLSNMGIFLAAGFAGNLGAIIARAHTHFPGVEASAWILTGKVLSLDNLSEQLFRVHWFPFEAISMLLLAAILGTVVLSKRRLD